MADEVFVDTSAWLAWLNRRDRLHERARSAILHCESQGTPLVTTAAVLLEVANSLSQPSLRPLAAAVYERVTLSPRIALVHIDNDVFARGLGAFRQQTR